VTGKLNIFTLIGEAVSGVVLAAVGIPVLLAGGTWVFF